MNDGGPSKGAHQERKGSLEGSSSCCKVKEKVLALLDQLVVVPGLRDMNEPGFVYRLDGASEGVIFCTPLPHLA